MKPTQIYVIIRFQDTKEWTKAFELDQVRADATGIMLDDEKWIIAGGYGDQSTWGNPQLGTYLDSTVIVQVSAA